MAEVDNTEEIKAESAKPEDFKDETAKAEEVKAEEVKADKTAPAKKEKPVISLKNVTMSFKISKRQFTKSQSGLFNDVKASVRS